MDEAIRLDPELSQPYANRALVFTLPGNDKETEQDVDRAVGLAIDLVFLEGAIEELKEQR